MTGLSFRRPPSMIDCTLLPGIVDVKAGIALSRSQQLVAAAGQAERGHVENL